jgi:DNA-binding NarL/FixJ family response regulator
MSTKVLICDERVLVRDGMVNQLSMDTCVDVVSVTDSGADVLALARRHHPDVVLASTTIRHMPVDKLVWELSQAALDPRPVAVVVTAVNEDAETLAEILHAGACGLLTEDASREELVLAVRAAAGGHAMLGPRVARWLVAWFRTHGQSAAEHPVDLIGVTPREREVLVLTARGLSTEDIAGRLFISLATVRSHLYRLQVKLHARDRAQLVSLAYQAGLLACRQDAVPVPAE